LVGQIGGECREVAPGLHGLHRVGPAGILDGVEPALVLGHVEYPQQFPAVGVGRPQATLPTIRPSQLHNRSS
jgi:hypothetical protein